MLPLPFGRFAELFGLRLPRGGLEYVLGGYMRFLQYVSRLVDVFETYLAVGASPTPCGSTSNTAESPAWLGRRPGDKPRCRCAGDPGREPPRIRISARLP